MNEKLLNYVVENEQKNDQNSIVAMRQLSLTDR